MVSRNSPPPAVSPPSAPARWSEIWRRTDGRAVAHALQEALWVVPAAPRGATDPSSRGRGVGPALVPATDPQRPPLPGSVLVLPIRPLDGLCAVVIPAVAQVACLDGRSLLPGPTVVSHGQSLEIAGHRCWFAVASQPSVVTYDPRLHGERRHCLLDATPLVPGELVVTCPGTAYDECSGLRRRESFVPGSVCPLCGCDPEERRHAPLGTPFHPTEGDRPSTPARGATHARV